MSAGAPLAVTGLGCLSRLGHDLATHRAALEATPAPLRPLAELGELPARFGDVPAGWIEPRESLRHRKWSPAAAAALHVARQAVDEAGWTTAGRKHAAVFFASSRGGLAGWLTPWPGRRDFPVMRAANSLLSEPAAAVSAELGFGGPWHVDASGCCAGLDALGTAALWLRAGKISRALVVAVDLPLVGPLLDAYDNSSMLARRDGPGMRPAEGAAALCLDSGPVSGTPELLDTTAAFEPAALLGSAAEMPGLVRLLGEAAERFGSPQLFIAHASGTARHAEAEPRALEEALGADMPAADLKAYTGHCVGAGGLLECTLACDLLRRPGATAIAPALEHTRPVFKLASALGGRHSLTILRS